MYTRAKLYTRAKPNYGYWLVNVVGTIPQLTISASGAYNISFLVLRLKDMSFKDTSPIFILINADASLEDTGFRLSMDHSVRVVS